MDFTISLMFKKMIDGATDADPSISAHCLPQLVGRYIAADCNWRI